MKHLIITSLALFLLISCTPFEQNTDSDKDNLLLQLEQDGATSTLHAYASNQQQWAWLLNKIKMGLKEGDATWLSIANELRRVSDAGASTSLDFTVARVLPYQPEMIMNEATGFSPETLCRVPFIEVDQETALQYLNKTISALQPLAASNNVNAQLCLDLLQQSSNKLRSIEFAH